MIIADTDVLIDTLRGYAPVARTIEDLLRSRRLATTAISRLELGVGAQSDSHRTAVEALLAAVPVLPLDSDAAGIAARIGADLRSEGQAIPLADLAIAGICLGLDVPLLTRNREHFERITGLRLAELQGSA